MNNNYLPRGGMVRAQTRRESFIESLINVVVGVGVAFVSQLVIFGAVGIHVSLALNGAMTFYFTVVSVARSMALRRYFNWRTERKLNNKPMVGWNNLTTDGYYK